MFKLIKKIFVIGMGLVLFIIFFMAFYKLIWHQFHTSTQANSISKKLIESTVVVGRSMQPTLSNGDIVSYNISLKPEAGNIIVFDCSTSQCINGENPNKIKRLIKINDQGCYWVEGDNKNLSWDSRNYGWLCGSDIKIQGVVIQ